MSAPEPGARLQHARAGEDVAPHEDLRGVLGVDHLRAAGHREHVVGEPGAQREVGRAGRATRRGCPRAGR